jgi:PAS domain S-box-containing protein
MGIHSHGLFVRLMPKGLVSTTRDAYEALRNTRDALETRLCERTAELQTTRAELAAETAKHERAERALHASQARLRALDAAGMIGILTTDSEGRVHDANDTFLEMVDYAREDVRSGELRWTELCASHGWPADAAAVELPQNDCNPSARERELLRKDGTRTPILLSTARLEGDSGERVAFMLDLTQSKQAEATETAAKRVAERLASAVESIQDAFALFDDADRLVLCNSVYCRLIGDALPGPLIGRTYEQVLDAWIGKICFADDGEREYFRRQRLELRHKYPTTSFDLRMRDGRSLRIVDRRTAEGGTVKTICDLTDDVRLAEELREARVIAEAASSAKSEFLSSMSHELRTPLNAILGFAQLLQRDQREPLSDRHRQRVAHILSGGEHLLHLIDDILDLARIESGKLAFSTEPLRVREVLDEVLATLQPMAARTDVRVELEATLEDAIVAADRTRFAQILMNFGSNAIKYNRPGGCVTFAVSNLNGSHVRVAVRDNGLGIPADKQDKLFQPFQRAGQEAGPIEGTGIGLVITQRLARLMQGDVGFSSVCGEGSEFWVDIPVPAESLRSSVPDAVCGVTPVRSFGAGRRLVLYIEDNSANVAFMRDVFGAFDNVDLLTAATAEIGVELARGRQPEVILMDINLPGLSGTDALRTLRSEHETKNIPVIALTAAASERDKQRGVQAGFCRYLTKPVKVGELVSALEDLLEHA